MYQDYLQKASSEQIINRHAPCEKNWPTNFQNFRHLVSNVTLLKPDHQKDFIELIDKLSSYQAARKSKQITLITDSLHFSEENKILLDFAICLKNCGCKLNVLSREGGSLEQWFENFGIKTCVISYKSKNWFEETTRPKKFNDSSSCFNRFF
ncbi:MAG: hypothetical protein HWD61_10640 [Parachlamydiaceae bacterium]|nr:MAG: hypothetical protein HWD61_10640 [Parachlamydiaceae bacterium]